MNSTEAPLIPFHPLADVFPLIDALCADVQANGLIELIILLDGKILDGRTLLEGPVREHSRKPEIFYELIETYFPTLPKIELNARPPLRPNWTAWGDEAAPCEGQCEAREAPPAKAGGKRAGRAANGRQ